MVYIRNAHDTFPRMIIKLIKINERDFEETEIIFKSYFNVDFQQPNKF